MKQFVIGQALRLVRSLLIGATASRPFPADQEKPMEMSRDEMLAMLSKLQAENAALRLAPQRKQTISFKVTEKGGMSLYGLGRFPVTLYRSQWDALLAHADQIAAFLKANANLLASKD